MGGPLSGKQASLEIRVLFQVVISLTETDLIELSGLVVAYEMAQ